jgi:hypothetical protein
MRFMVTLRVLQAICGLKNSTLVCIGRWVGLVEDPDFAKQNDRGSSARPLTDFPTKLLKQGFDVPPRQAAA